MKKTFLLLFFLLTAFCFLPSAVRAQGTPGTVRCPSQADTLDSLFRIKDAARTVLADVVTPSSTSITVSSTAAFPASGSLKINDEIIYYSSTTSTSFGTLVRGASGTAAASHANSSLVSAPILAAHHNTLAQAVVCAEQLGLAAVPGSRTVNGHPLSADVMVTSSDVGLGNANNTSDANKPVSTATQTALDAKQNSLGFPPENAANKDTDGTLASNSDTKYASQKAVKTYIDAHAGAGSVTVVGGGNLNVNAIVTGGGSQTVQTPSANTTLDGSGNISTPGTIASGAGGSSPGVVTMLHGTAPSSPAANNLSLFFDSADDHLKSKNSSGTVTDLQAGGGGVVLGDSPIWTGAHAWSKNGAASSPAGLFSGIWFTGGSSTTTKPQFLIEPTGTSSTAWNTNGTGLGVNAASGFTGNLFDYQINGESRGSLSYTGEFLVGNHVTNGNYVHFAGSNGYQQPSTLKIGYSESGENGADTTKIILNTGTGGDCCYVNLHRPSIGFAVGQAAANSGIAPLQTDSSGTGGVGIEVNNGTLGIYADVKLRGLQYTTASKPTCGSTSLGTTWYVAGGAGVKDTFEVCAKDAGDGYAWRVIY